jgi:two-component system, LytTR family, sensor kinase
MRLIFVVLFCLPTLVTRSQVTWWESNISFNSIDWFNYSTSYAGDDQSKIPTIVTARPYNGIYNYYEGATTEPSFSIDSSLFRFSSKLIGNSQQYDTYDSSEVYFLTPAIFSSNAGDYEYRILLNGKTIVKKWTAITRFADSSFQLNNFKKGMAFLGGYKTIWDNFLVAQIKKKNTGDILSFSMVYWKQVKPALMNIYTPDDLNHFLARLKKSYIQSITKEEYQKWQSLYKPEEIEPGTMLPKKLILHAKDDNIIFYLQGDIYKKEALEYQLIKDNTVFSAWKANDFDNNVIWLKELLPGDYQLQMRYGSQRHNISTYPFYIQPDWYNHPGFKLAIGFAVVLLIFLLIRLRKQKQKTATEKAKKEKLNLELKALRSQLNPHFIFNALSSIQGLINKQDTSAANHYLTEFSSLLRETLRNGDNEFLPLEKELKMLHTYLQLEQLRFHFKYKVSTKANLAIAEIEIPALLIQPLVENAIRHGAGPQYENGVIEVNFSARDKNFLIDIADNGTGFAMEQSYIGYGLKLVKERVALLNESLEDQAIYLSAESNKNDCTIVHLIFENWL